MSEKKYLLLTATIKALKYFYKIPNSGFSIGNCVNGPNENTGSLLIFMYARAGKQVLSNDQIKELFAEAWDEVVEDPEGSSHQNIRNFIQYGIAGVVFENEKEVIVCTECFCPSFKLIGLIRDQVLSYSQEINNV